MKKHLSLTMILAATWAAALQAGPISYSVTVNTSALNGQSGNLDFQFNGGNPPYDPATATVSLFSTNGVLGSPAILSGSVTPGNAQLPSGFALNNTAIFNDLFQPIVFGSQIQFTVTLSGIALTSPSGSTASGSTFLFSLYDASGINPLLTSDPSGGVAAIQVNQNGTTTPQALPNGTNPSVATLAVVTPEPAAGMLLLLGVALLGARRFTAQ
jgi:hypothetical protein